MVEFGKYQAYAAHGHQTFSAALRYYRAMTLSDPAGSVPIEDAVRWLEGTVLGTLATTLAIIAVAALAS